MDSAWSIISIFGDYPFWIIFTLTFSLFYATLPGKTRNRMRWFFRVLLPSIALSAAIGAAIKMSLQIPRICEGMVYCPPGYSFPSVHAAIIFAFATSVLLYTRKPVFYAPALAFATTVSYSRLALGVHTAIDVISGMSLGIATAMAWFIIYGFAVDGGISIRKTNHFYFRKLVHFSGIIIIALNFAIPKPYMLAFLGLLSSLFLLSEACRMGGIYFPVVQEITLYCSKKKEADGFVIAPLLFCLAMIFLVLLPEKPFIIGAVSIVIGDTAAGLVGYTFGKHPISHCKSKTWEGTAAFFVATFAALSLFLNPAEAIVFSAITAGLESIFVKYENLLLPVCAAIFAIVL